MSEVDDATAVLTEMLEHANAGRSSEAVASAEKAMALARKLQNPKLKALLTAHATSTWLTSKAALDPDDLSLIKRCDRVFERLCKPATDQLAMTAIVAQGVKIELLLRARKVPEAGVASEHLGEFFAGRPVGDKLPEQTAEIIRIALNMVAMGAPAWAAPLAQRVVARFADDASSENRVFAATAQAWVLIAMMARDDKSELGFPVPPASPEELRSMLDADDPPSLDPAGVETKKFIAMGDAGLTAIELLLPRLKRYGSHLDPARLLLMMLRVVILEEAGRNEERYAGERLVVDEFGEEEEWRVREFVGWVRRDLDSPR